MGHFGEVRETLKAWLPNIRIINPDNMKKTFVAELCNWLVWQTSNTHDQV